MNILEDSDEASQSSVVSGVNRILPNHLLFNKLTPSADNVVAQKRPKKPRDISYKDIEILKLCMSENGRILPKRLIENVLRRMNLRMRDVKVLIKRARILALLPFAKN